MDKNFLHNSAKVRDGGTRFKIILIGDSDVGKTSLIERYCNPNSKCRPRATIGFDFISQSVEVDGEEILLEIWDTAGQERFRKSMVKHFYRNANAVIFVYDITRIVTFYSLRKWMEECEDNCPRNIARVLIGNKCDNRRNVDTVMGKQFAREYVMPFYEVSAKMGSSQIIESIFLNLAMKLKNLHSLGIEHEQDSDFIVIDKKPPGDEYTPPTQRYC